MVPVHSVADLTVQGNAIARELAMVKVAGKGEKRVEALRLADAFRARVIDATTESFVFELTGKTDKIEQFISLMQPSGPGRSGAHRRCRHFARARGHEDLSDRRNGIEHQSRAASRCSQLVCQNCLKADIFYRPLDW